MKLVVRAIGNSLGVIIPRQALAAWGVDKGGVLELADNCIRPPYRSARSQDVLDELKRRIATAVTASFSAHQIRAHSLANLHRWRSSGAWVSAYDEWRQILERGDDGELFATMLGRDERSNRLRQSAPYVGLLPREEVRRLNEEASA
jgi:antitoxin component of MazEF toxin-antitoxin module